MDIQPGDCSKSHCIICFKWVNCMLDYLYINNAIKNAIEDKLIILSKEFEESQHHDIVITSNKLEESHLRNRNNRVT